MRDNGTYMTLDVGHTFNLLGGDDDTLTLKLSDREPAILWFE